MLGIDVDCLPLADVPAPGGDPVIGDRAYGTEPAKVAAIAGAIAQGLLAGGVLPVLKHLPGHGRAAADSHHRLPVVDTDRATLEATDFAAFRPLSRLPLGMTAHVVFSAIDPVAPATTSVTMVREVIRGFIGFRGLLMSDDVSMNALSGTIAERSRAAFAAGCDVVLHCNGSLARWPRSPARRRCWRAGPPQRADAALAQRSAPEAFDVDSARKIFAQMVAADAAATEDRFMTPEEFDSTLEADRGTTEPAMIVDVEGFEGPLDLLLALARTQKVDLAKISILALADQYLTFIEAARKLRLELAADYLVMAAWLAYLKSRLLLPESAPGEGPSAEDMALALAYRLRRLEALRDVATRLMGRPQLNRDVFARGAPEPIDEIKQSEWTATLYDLLSAYATQRARSALSRVRFKQRTVWSLAEARAALERLIGMSSDWSRIDAFLISYVVEPALAATVMASSFASALELVREGIAEIHQKESFAPIYMRKRVGMNRSAATHDAQENA